jgi:phosphoenolpyruvate carboxylase
MLRYSKLTVADEIENALSYYRITFLRELPGLYDDIEPTSPRTRRRRRHRRHRAPTCRWAAGSAATATATQRQRAPPTR